MPLSRELLRNWSLYREHRHGLRHADRRLQGLRLNGRPLRRLDHRVRHLIAIDGKLIRTLLHRSGRGCCSGATLLPQNDRLRLILVVHRHELLTLIGFDFLYAILVHFFISNMCLANVLLHLVLRSGAIVVAVI